MATLMCKVSKSMTKEASITPPRWTQKKRSGKVKDWNGTIMECHSRPISLRQTSMCVSVCTALTDVLLPANEREREREGEGEGEGEGEAQSGPDDWLFPPWHGDRHGDRTAVT